jgi:hypothetical protein
MQPAGDLSTQRPELLGRKPGGRVGQVEAFLDDSGRVRCDLGRQVEGGGQRLADRHDPGDQAQAGRLGRVQTAAGEDQFERPRSGKGAGQPKYAAPVGDEPAGDLR